jgi:hypothetical protein
LLIASREPWAAPISCPTIATRKKLSDVQPFHPSVSKNYFLDQKITGFEFRLSDERQGVAVEGLPIAFVES